MPDQHFILGMAGHIDHGKSALVQALTGVDPDRLPEEQARGMTIDLGFAHLALRKGVGSHFLLGIVDVPGHAHFINNMVSGIGSLDVALMTVAADDGWMPQSEEHFQILQYLGIERLVVALTKADLVADLGPAISDLRKRLAGSPFADAPIVPTSVLHGQENNQGLDELREALANILDQTEPPQDIGKPRLPIDRVFSQPGIGTIVTGTLTGGSFQRGQQVVVQPAKLSARIRSIQSHNRDLETIGPGRRVALNLADLPLAGAGQRGIARGDVITLETLGELTDTLHVWLHRTSRERGNLFPLKHAARIRWHHGGTHAPAKIYFVDRKQLEPGDSALAQIRLERPLCLFEGDRFLVRNWAKSATLAGGIVLERKAKQRGYRDPDRVANLQRLFQASGNMRQSILATLATHQAIERSKLLLQSHYGAKQIEAEVNRLVEKGEVVLAGDYVADGPWWEALIRQALATVDAEHEQRPQLPGIAISQLRSELEPSLPVAPLFDSLLRCLSAHGLQQVGPIVRRVSHRPELPPLLKTAGEKIRQTLQAASFKPPPRKELASDKGSIEALTFLLQQGEIVEVQDNLVLLADSLEQAKKLVGNYLEKNGPATLSQLRELLKTNRRVIVPLIERFDQEGLTLRQGNLRQLKQ